MPVLEFNFKDVWTMEDACGDDATDSKNPAPNTSPGIYIIHNANGSINSTYVGYAANARNRWSTRFEVLHCFGVPASYGKNIHCGFCTPTFNGPTSLNYEGSLGCEHALIRAVANGVLGPTTCTNTKLSNYLFHYSHDNVEVRIYFPVGHFAKWGKLENAKNVKIAKGIGY